MLQRKPRKGDIVKCITPNGAKYYTVTRIEGQLAHTKYDHDKTSVFVWKWHNDDLNKLHSIATCGDCKFLVNEECNGFYHEGKERFSDDYACADFAPAC